MSMEIMLKIDEGHYNQNITILIYDSELTSDIGLHVILSQYGIVRKYNVLKIGTICYNNHLKICQKNTELHSCLLTE
jgi:hypothetical protein